MRRATGTLLAGNICNTNIYEPDRADSAKAVRAIFDEQVAWAAEASVDLVIAETISWVGEAQIALESIRAAGLPAVVTMTIHQDVTTRDGYSAAEACRALAGAGADVVGLNCCRGPSTMLPLIAEIVDAVDVPVAALPVPYRTTPEQPTFQSLRDPDYDGYPTGQPFPTGLDPFTCTRYELADFARAASDLGASYLGVCCGAAPHHIRAVAEALGRTPEASRYTEDMSKHAYFGTDASLQRSNQEYPPACRVRRKDALAGSSAGSAGADRWSIRLGRSTSRLRRRPRSALLRARRASSACDGETYRLVAGGVGLRCLAMDVGSTVAARTTLSKCRLSVRTCSRDVSTRYRLPRYSAARWLPNTVSGEA